MELPQVEMKPVRATVRAVRHFFLVDQLRGFAGEVAKLSSVSAASRAEAVVNDVEVCLRGGKGCIEPSTGLGGSVGAIVEVGDGATTDRVPSSSG